MSKPLSFLIIIFLCFITIQSYSQDSTSSDGLFQMARSAAFDEKNYPKAIELSKKALAISPRYTDIRIFLGRVYTWSDQYDSAKAAFEYVLDYSPENEDASAAYTDLEYRNDNNESALRIADNGLKHHPNSESLLVRKAKILYALRRYEESATVIDAILRLNKNNTEARALSERIREVRAKNRIGISYDFTSFDKQFADPWHIVSFDYGRQTRLGSFTARINYANRFKESGVQYEVDAYPRINKTFYSYLSFGYSGDVGVFPKYRAGASLYINLPESFEAEVGTRYLYFSDATWIYTLYLGKYYKSWLFGARTYLTPSDNNISQSYNMMAKYYYGGADDYLHLNIGTGISPDDRPSAILLNSNYKLQSNKASVAWKKSITKLNIIGVSAGWVNQEYLQKTKGNQFDIGISYQRRF
jgi:YaiO family outer membrane protein